MLIALALTDLQCLLNQRQVASGEKKAATLTEWMDNESSEEEEVSQPRLSLTNEPRLSPTNEPHDNRYDNHSSSAQTEPGLDPTGVWEHRVETEATIVVAQAGKSPAQLTYIRCHREARRQLLLQGKVKKQWERPCLQHVVEIAAQLAKDGSLPGLHGEHGRRGSQRTLYYR